MGYCYDAATGQLVCDRCSTHGGVRRVKCKYGWCQAVALCKGCRKEGTKEFRESCEERGCQQASEEFQARLDREERALAAGKFVRRSAVSVGDGKVSVLFRDQNDYTVEHIVTNEEYDRVGIGNVATLEDYGISYGARL